MKPKHFLIGASSIIVIAFFILLFRWTKCKNANPCMQGNCPDCSFWTGKLIANNTPNPVDDNSATAQPGGATGLYPVIVTRSTGAPIYIIVNGVFTLTGAKLPYETQLPGDLLVTSSGSWYKTSKGWLNSNDISIDTLSPH